MNILVTGANGFIGKKVSSALEHEGHRIYRLVRSGGNKSKDTIEVDLTDNNQVIDFCKHFKNEKQVDMVIHLASKMADYKHDEYQQLSVLEDNIEITKNMVLITKKLKLNKIINLSSIAVYPNIDGVFDENSKIDMSSNSDCLYGLSKFCSENIFQYMFKNEKTVVTNLRVAQVYGEGMRDDRIIPIMRSELKEENTITVFGQGERISNFIHIDKLIEIIKCFVVNDIDGVCNIGDESLSYMDIAKSLIGEYGNGASRIILKDNGVRAKFVLDTKKMKEIINNFCINSQKGIR